MLTVLGVRVIGELLWDRFVLQMPDEVENLEVTQISRLHLLSSALRKV